MIAITKMLALSRLQTCLLLSILLLGLCYFFLPVEKASWFSTVSYSGTLTPQMIQDT
jgi:hypothetical protein